MWSRRSYAILVAAMAATESVISLLLLGLQQGSKGAVDFVAAVIGFNGYIPITLAAAALLAAPVARRLTGERRALRFVETLVVAVITYLIFNVLGIAAGVLLSSGSSSSSNGAVPTPLPNTSASPSGSLQSSPTPSSTGTPSPASTPAPSATPAPTSPPVASGGSAGNAASFKVGVPSAISAGQQFSITVQAVDSGGGRAQGFTNAVSIASSDAAAALANSYAFTSGDNGAHTFLIALNTPGSQTITVTDSSVASIKGKSSTVTVAGQPTKLALAPSSPIAAEEQGSVRVTVEDKNNRRVTDYAGTIHFSSSDAKATLPPDYTFTTGDCGATASSHLDCGQHTFNVTFSASGQPTVGAKDTAAANISGVSPAVQVTFSIPVVLAADGVIIALSYVATVFVYPPLYKRLRTRPRPQGQSGGARDRGNQSKDRRGK